MGAVVQHKNQHESSPTALGLVEPGEWGPLVTNQSCVESDARVPEVEREVLTDLLCSPCLLDTTPRLLGLRISRDIELSYGSASRAAPSFPPSRSSPNHHSLITTIDDS
jgi:hypothetical protein